MYKFELQNREPIQIEQLPDEHDETHDYHESFWWNNKRYYIEDFTRCHNNSWFCGEVPDYIHGVESENYYDPIYIELIDGYSFDGAVNIYKEIRVDD